MDRIIHIRDTHNRGWALCGASWKTIPQSKNGLFKMCGTCQTLGLSKIIHAPIVIPTQASKEYDPSLSIKEKPLVVDKTYDPDKTVFRFLDAAGEKIYSFYGDIYVNPAHEWTTEEVHTFHSLLKNFENAVISVNHEAIQRFVTNPDMYDAFGDPFPTMETYNPNVETFYGRKTIEEKLKELKERGYDIPSTEVNDDMKYVVIDYSKLKKVQKNFYSSVPAEFKQDDLPTYNDQDTSFTPLIAKIVGEIPNVKPLLEAQDLINHPSHYTHYKGVEVIDVTEELNFNRGNAVKYIARAGFKNEDTEIQDLEKALWYVEREIGRDVHEHSLGDIHRVEKLCEQMNYHRGNAVWLIACAGNVGISSVNINLNEATHSIKAEIKRIKNIVEEES